MSERNFKSRKFWILFFFGVRSFGGLTERVVAGFLDPVSVPIVMSSQFLVSISIILMFGFIPSCTLI